MSEVVIPGSRGVAPFEPAKAQKRDAQYDAVIEYCKRVKDWPLLEQAVAAKIEEQAAFVEWWEENLPHGGDRSKSAGLRTWSAEDIERETKISHQQVSKWRRWLKDREGYAAKLYGAAYRKAMADVHNHLANGSGENEWYTPAKYIEAARDVLLGIDLDPASSAVAQETVQADEYYTATDDALDREWHGRVWLNPPYSKDLIPLFIAKLVNEFGSGRVSSAILLTHSYTDTAWFHTAESRCHAVCFTRGRIGFVSPSGEIAAPTQGQAFFYYGPDVDVFAGRFREFGFIR